MKCNRQFIRSRCVAWHQRCMVCRKLYREQEGETSAIRLCDTCWNLVRDCRLKQMVHATHDEQVHCACFHYINEARDLLWHYKFNAVKPIANLYANEVADGLSRWFKGCALVPIPASLDNVKRRGWDQVSVITKILANTHNIEALPLLRRTGKQATKKLNRARRLSAVQTQYGLSKLFAQHRRENHTVVLFDDVYTTGTTIATCTELLQQQGVNVRGSLTLYRCA